MNIIQRIESFTKLGEFLYQFVSIDTPKTDHPLNTIFYDNFQELILASSQKNPWFTPEHVRFSLKGICHFLKKDKLKNWISNYPVSQENTGKCVAVIMAGNIPMVGFHDMLSVLISGHQFLGKLSSKDNQLLDMVARMLHHINPQWKELIDFRTQPLSSKNDFDAIIATGSDNSARYFHAYFGKYPHIIRRNRNAIAIITGKESQQELQTLGSDIFLYFGLGCRNVSKLLIPQGYPLASLLATWEPYGNIIQHNKYANNYDYHKSIYLMNGIEHLDTGFLLLKEDTAVASPIGVVFYEYYSDIHSTYDWVNAHKQQIQCIVGNCPELPEVIPFGKAQEPDLGDYADNVDTLEFLTKL